MGTPANVRVGASGVISTAPTSTTLPDSVNDALDGAFTDVGLISDEGVTESIGRDSNKIVAWGGDTVREVSTTHDLTYQFTMLETNDLALEVYYGVAPVGDVLEVTSAQGYRGAWVIHVVDGDELIRIVLPDAQVSAQGDVQYVTEEAVARQVTLTAYPDGDGVKAYIHLGEAASG